MNEQNETENSHDTNNIIVEDRLDDYQSLNETLRIGRFSCVKLKVFFPRIFQDWFFNTNAQPINPTNNNNSHDFILQQILSALSPRLKKDLDDLTKKSGSSSTQNNPQVIITDEFVFIYFFVPDSSRIDAPSFRVLPPKYYSDSTCSQAFSALRFHNMSVFLAVHPSPMRVQKLFAENPLLERNLDDTYIDESIVLLTSHKIAAKLLSRFKIN